MRAVRTGLPGLVLAVSSGAGAGEMVLPNGLQLDGGYRIKVRAADGLEGWVPATAIRAIR